MPIYRFRTQIDDSETLHSSHALFNDLAAWSYACRLMSEVMEEREECQSGSHSTCHCHVLDEGGRHLMELHFDGHIHGDAVILRELEQYANG